MKSSVLKDVGLVASSPNARQKEFHFSTNYISELYLSKLPRVETSGTRSVNVCLRPLGSVQNRLDRIGPLTEIDREFDFDCFWNGDEVARKALALRALHNGLIEIASVEAWGVEPFNFAFAGCIGPVTAYEFRLGKVAWNSSRSMCAEVSCLFNFKEIVVTVVVTSRSGSIMLRKVVAKLKPHTIFLKRLVGRIRWRTSDTVELVNAAGNVLSSSEVR